MGRAKEKSRARAPLRFVSDSGFEILVGRSNAQNDELTHRMARRTDLWLHVQKLPGSHVIVPQREGEADEAPVRTAVFVFASEDRRNDHLRALAMVAQTILAPRFDARWSRARTPQQLRDIFLLARRTRGPQGGI